MTDAAAQPLVTHKTLHQACGSRQATTTPGLRLRRPQPGPRTPTDILAVAELNPPGVGRIIRRLCPVSGHVSGRKSHDICRLIITPPMRWCGEASGSHEAAGCDVAGRRADCERRGVVPTQ